MSSLTYSDLQDELTIESPANSAFTNIEILRGSSKSPNVTALTAKRDCVLSCVSAIFEMLEMPIENEDVGLMAQK